MFTLWQTGRTQANSINPAAANEVSANQAIQKRGARRDVFLHPETLPHKSLYQQLFGLVSQVISQIMGREEAGEQRDQQQRRSKEQASNTPLAEADETGAPREVRGIADRMPRIMDPHNPFPKRDLVLLGEDKDYPQAVLAIELAGEIKPVFYEGSQVVARNLMLDDQLTPVEGVLLLADGSRLAIRIHVWTAY